MKITEGVCEELLNGPTWNLKQIVLEETNSTIDLLSYCGMKVKSWQISKC